MTRLPRLKGRELVRLLERIRFERARPRNRRIFLKQNRHLLLPWIGVVLFLGGCRHKRGAELIGGFVGYETIQEVRDHSVKLNPSQQWAEEKERVEPTDKRPPHAFVYLSGNFRDLGCDGKLRLTFYNNRLSRILAV